MTCYANQELQSWHDSRLAEIQQMERIVKEHIEGMRIRGEHYGEPMKTEAISMANALENLQHLYELKAT